MLLKIIESILDFMIPLREDILKNKIVRYKLFEELSIGDTFCIDTDDWYTKIMIEGDVFYFKYNWKCVVEQKDMFIPPKKPCLIAKEVEFDFDIWSDGI